jgi:hypothetical protein
VKGNQPFWTGRNRTVLRTRPLIASQEAYRILVVTQESTTVYASLGGRSVLVRPCRRALTSRNEIDQEPAGLHRIDSEPEHLLAVFDELHMVHQLDSAMMNVTIYLVRLLGQRPVRDSDHDAAHRAEYIQSALLKNKSDRKRTFGSHRSSPVAGPGG